jgi:hypothetical protein
VLEFGRYRHEGLSNSRRWNGKNASRFHSPEFGSWSSTFEIVAPESGRRTTTGEVVIQGGWRGRGLVSPRALRTRSSCCDRNLAQVRMGRKVKTGNMDHQLDVIDRNVAKTYE